MDVGGSAASCSGTPAASGPLYITVQFEDGPASGLLAEVSEDDYCEPRYWRFEEIHLRRPLAKVLYNDGDVSFVRDWPVALEGELLDQDGDEHRYLREEQAQPVQESVVDANLSSAIPGSRPAPGGYGRCVVALDSEAASLTSPPAEKIGRRKRAAEADWTPASVKRSTPRASTSSSLGKRPRRDVVADAPKISEATIAPEASCSPPASSAPQASSVPEASSNPEASSTPEASSAPQASSGPRRCSITIERAKSGRASCRSCGQGIERDAVRCGVEVYAGGRLTMQWAHAECFREKINAERVTARRGKCKGSGEPFAVGDVRVGFELGSSKTWWCLREAATWTQRLVAEEGRRISAIASSDDLGDEQCAAVLAQLNGDTSALEAGEGIATLPAESSASTASALADMAEVLAPESVVADIEGGESDSDIEVEYGETGDDAEA